MGAFDDISLDWDGKTYTIPANKVLGAIARIEDVMTLGELLAYVERETAPFGKIAAAYGAVLRYAGCKVSNEDVYTGIFAAATPAAVQTVVISSLTTLLAMMMPKQVGATAKESPQGNRRARRAAAAGAGSSKKPTKQQ
jgi:hypothetical protein